MKRILVVDDDRDIAEIVSDLLQGEGHQTMIAYDGKEALEKIRRERPDLIVTDIKMPTLDGLKMLEFLKSDPALALIPTIVLTATQVIREAQDRFRQLGVYRWIAKPFEPEELLTTVSEALQSGG